MRCKFKGKRKDEQYLARTAFGDIERFENFYY